MKNLSAQAEEEYELMRDNCRTTTCWQSRNNGCMPHFHASIELVYVISGVMTAIINGQTYAVRQGHLLLVSSYAVHAYRTEENEQNVVVVMTIPLPFVPTLQKKLNKMAFAKAIYDARQDEEISTLMPMLSQYLQSYDEIAGQGFSYAILGLLSSRVGLVDQPSNQQSGLMRDVLIYLQENYQQQLRMESLARHFGYSKSRFSRLFHDHLGCSMIEYLSALRCRQAAQLLLEKDMTMLDVAMGVGFECLRTFYRAFKSYYHMTPTQYVKNHTAK